MRPFPHDDPGRLPKTNAERARFAALPLLILVTTWTQGCAGLGSAFGTSTPTPPSAPPSGSIAVAVTPASATVILGNPQMFTATVTNASDTTVVWSVNGVAGGNAATGTISTAGVYTAPAELPASPAVRIAATSQADATKSGTSQVAIASDLQVALSATAARVELGAKQAFRALITSSGNPNGGVTWTLSGAACLAGCGAVDANGNFTAPQILPATATATLTAQSVADPTKRASAALTITSNFTLLAFRAGDRAGGHFSWNHGHAHAGARLESERSARVVVVRQRVQRISVRSAHRVHRAV